MDEDEGVYRMLIWMLAVGIVVLLAVGWVTKVQVDYWNKMNKVNDQPTTERGE